MFVSMRACTMTFMIKRKQQKLEAKKSWMVPPRPQLEKVRPSERLYNLRLNFNAEHTSLVTSIVVGTGGIRRDKQPFFYKVTCRDNGQGMPHDSIPEMFGIVLSGTKYNVKQTRGKFGLGAKMALIWSKMTTGFPIEIRSRQRNSPTESFCKLDIDIFKNRPNVHLHEEKPASSK